LKAKVKKGTCGTVEQNTLVTAGLDNRPTRGKFEKSGQPPNQEAVAIR